MGFFLLHCLLLLSKAAVFKNKNHQTEKKEIPSSAKTNLHVSTTFIKSVPFFCEPTEMAPGSLKMHAHAFSIANRVINFRELQRTIASSFSKTWVFPAVKTVRLLVVLSLYPGPCGQRDTTPLPLKLTGLQLFCLVFYRV